MKALFYIATSILCIAMCPKPSGALSFVAIFLAGGVYAYGVFLHRRQTGQLC